MEINHESFSLSIYFVNLLIKQCVIRNEKMYVVRCNYCQLTVCVCGLYRIIETNLYGSFNLHVLFLLFNHNSQFAMILLPVQLMTSFAVSND